MEMVMQQITQYLLDLLLPFMRISGLFAAMIGLGAKTMPKQVRILLTLTLTIVIVPIVPPTPIEELFSLRTWLEVVQQLLIGIGIGFISMMVLNTFVVAGQIVAMQTGLGFASIVDPVNGINVPAVGQFFLILSTLLFWAVDGHLAMLKMIVMSFETLPIASGWWEALNYKKIVDWMAWIFIAAVNLSLAPMVALLVINLAFGIMTKASPQLNIFSIGFAVTQICGLILIWLVMSEFAFHFDQQWQRAQQLMCELLVVCK